MPLSLARIKELLAKMKNVRIAVTGDFCLDRYGNAVVGGLSRETGNKLIRVSSHFFSPGGAANVAANVADLGVQCRALTILGKDDFGDIMVRLLKAKGIDTSSILQDAQRMTPSFEKINVRDGANRFENRLDVVNSRQISGEAERKYVELLESVSREVDCLIVADYDEAGSGIITQRAIETISKIGRREDFRLLVTSRQRVRSFCPAMPVVNEYEAVTAAGIKGASLFGSVDEETLDAAGRKLAELNKRTAFVTVGKAGTNVYEPSGKRTRVLTVEAAGEIDIVGAGDSALGAIAGSLCAGASAVEAAAMGNIAANVTVRKIGITGTAKPEEVVKAFETYWTKSIIERIAGSATETDTGL